MALRAYTLFISEIKFNQNLSHFWEIVHPTESNILSHDLKEVL